MCQSIAEGGKRCATHTRPAYQDSLRAFLATPDRELTTGKYHDMFSTAKAFASTKKGFGEVEQDIEKYKLENKSELTSVLEDALFYGKMALKQQKEIDDEIKQELTPRVDKTLADALTAVGAAVALGFPAPSFVGSKYYSVYVSTINYNYGESDDHDEYDRDTQEFLGDYPTEELAKKALTTWIKEKMNTETPTGRQILGPDGEVYWVAKGETKWVAGEKATQEEIIHDYFSIEHSKGFLIQEKELVGVLKPEAKYGERREPRIPDRNFIYHNRR